MKTNVPAPVVLVMVPAAFATLPWVNNPCTNKVLPFKSSVAPFSTLKPEAAGKAFSGVFRRTVPSVILIVPEEYCRAETMSVPPSPLLKVLVMIEPCRSRVEPVAT